MRVSIFSIIFIEEDEGVPVLSEPFVEFALGLLDPVV